MKNRWPLLRHKLYALLPALAMLLAANSVTSTCFCAIYQPDVPEGLEALVAEKHRAL